jgi:hypothetical protein
MTPWQALRYSRLYATSSTQPQAYSLAVRPVGPIEVLTVAPEVRAGRRINDAYACISTLDAQDGAYEAFRWVG